MTKLFQMSVYDLNGKKLCSLYDSRAAQDGAAQGIKVKKEIGGWKDISFNLSKYNQKGEQNFRCDFIRNEYHLKVVEDDNVDVYCIKAPGALHDKSKVQYTITANHISEELKTKNIFKYFDDTNGIGTCEELITKALKGSGWKLIACDKFLESDGSTEKIRSYSCETKTGAWNMISDICELFDARPVFHGGNRTVEIHATSNTEGWMEILFGKNLSKVKRTADSDKVATRLYVEGEYGDYGYVGIDDINPTGLPFILNFDYYKDIGMFTDEHQQIVDQYVIDYKKSSDDIKAITTEYLNKYAELTELVGNLGYVYYPIIDGEVDKNNLIATSDVTKEKKALNPGDKAYYVSTNGSYEVMEYSSNTSLTGIICIIKFIPAATGMLAAYEDMVKVSKRSIDNYLDKLNYYLRRDKYDEITLDELKAAYGTNDLSIVKNEDFDLTGVAEQYTKDNILEYAVSIGDEEKSIVETQIKLNEAMLRAIELIQIVDELNKNIETAAFAQEDIEEAFAESMGSLLRDGYWSDTNYTVGQEQSLYNDALEISKKLAQPTVSYTIETHDLSIKEEYKGEEFKLAQTVRIYDPEIKLNDYGIVSELTIYPDKPTSNSIAIKTDLLDIGTKSFASILERVTSLAEQVRRNKNKYERAAAISKDGTIHSDMLEGAIDVMKTQLLSNASNWRTDEKGNIIFITLDGKCAMMLCGSGFMIANSKLENGDWNWRTFGTGNGFAADLITTGYLDAARIDTDELLAKEGFIDKITTNIIQSTDLGTQIEMANQKIDMIVSSESSESELVLTDFMMSLITNEVQVAVNKIDLSANESIKAIVKNEVTENISAVEMTQEKFEAFVRDSEEISKIEMTPEKFDAYVENSEAIGSLEMTPEKFEALVENSDGVAKVSQKANEIDMLIQGDSTSTNVKYTDAAIEAMSENIDLKVNNEFNLTIDEIKTSIKANAAEIEMAAQEITLITRDTRKNTAKVFRQEEFPDGRDDVEPNDVLVIPSSGQIYQAIDMSNLNIKFYLESNGDLTYSIDDSSDHYKLEMQGYDLYAENFTITIKEDGTVGSPYNWELVQDLELLYGIEGLEEEFRRVIRIDDDGLHVGDNKSKNEVLIDSESVNIKIGAANDYSKFTAKYVQFGSYQLRQSADGGLVFKVR